MTESRTCPYCAETIDPGTDTCPHCESVLAQPEDDSAEDSSSTEREHDESQSEWTCPSCGGSLQEIFEYCRHCGAEVGPTLRRQTMGEGEEEETPEQEPLETEHASEDEDVDLDTSFGGVPDMFEQLAWLFACGIAVYLVGFVIWGDLGIENESSSRSGQTEDETEELTRLVESPSREAFSKLTSNYTSDRIQNALEESPKPWKQFLSTDLSKLAEDTSSADGLCEDLRPFSESGAFPDELTALKESCEELSDVEMRLSEIREKENRRERLENEIERLKDRRENLAEKKREASPFTCSGEILQKLGQNKYNFQDRFGNPNLLITTDTVFTTKGHFSLECRRSGEATVTLKNGFEKSVDKYVEADNSEELRFQAELSSVNSDLEDKRSALKELPTYVGSKEQELADKRDELKSEVLSQTRLEADLVPSMDAYLKLSDAPDTVVKDRLANLSGSKERAWEDFFAENFPAVAEAASGADSLCNETDVFAGQDLFPESFELFHGACERLEGAPGHESQADDYLFRLDRLIADELAEVIYAFVESRKPKRENLEAPEKPRIEWFSASEFSAKVMKAESSIQLEVYTSPEKSSSQIGTVGFAENEKLPRDHRERQYLELEPPEVIADRGGVIIGRDRMVSIREGETVYVLDRRPEGGGYEIFFDGSEYGVPGKFFDSIGVERPGFPKKWSSGWVYTKKGEGGWVRVTSEQFRVDSVSTMPEVDRPPADEQPDAGTDSSSSETESPDAGSPNDAGPSASSTGREASADNAPPTDNENSTSDESSSKREFVEGDPREIGAQRIVPRVGFEKPLHRRGGSIDLESTTDVLREAADEWLTCYARRLADRTDAKGAVVIKFTLASDGTVNLAHATSNSVGGELGECVADRLETLEFPSSKFGGVFLRQTMHFDHQILEADVSDSGETSSSKTAASSSDVDVEVTVGDTHHKRGAGTIAPEQVHNLLRQNLDAVESCYGAEQPDDTARNGKIVVKFTIATDGTVSLSHVTNDTVSGGTGECVSEVVKDLEFPVPEGGSVFLQQTLQFTADRQ